MTSGGAEALKAAIRRSLFLIVLLVLLGIVSVNAFEQSRGPRYESHARVLISPTSLAQIITGTVPPFVDPNRIEETARALAESPEVYTVAARRTGFTLGTASEMQAATTVTGGANDDILTFAARGSDPRRTVGTANAVARAYIAWRAELNGRTIRRTEAELTAKLDALAPNDVARADIKSLLNKLEALDTANSGDTQLVARAVSAGKTSPAPVKDTILGLSIGLVIALLVVALREAIDTTVRSESDIEELLSAPVLATVRSLPRRSRMVTYGRHEAAFSDTYALLAANLAQARSTDKPMVLAVTSAVSREGKTTTAGNLAVSLARRGTRVLIADFDFRKPALTDLFQIPKTSPGVLQVLAGSVRLEDCLWSVTLSGTRPRVSKNGAMPTSAEPSSTNGHETEPAAGSLVLLPSGGAVRSHSGTLAHRLGPLLKQLRSRADFVIIDTPPALLTVEMAELSRLIDDVLVVVRQGRVTQRSLRSLSRQARSWPAEVAGAVLTDVPGGEEQYAYYGSR
jgi:Mrp family chromosome partitioning ATPase/capsular polysaccharide biosynthesis protein